MHFQKSTEPYDIYSTISSSWTGYMSLFERDGLKNTYIAYMLAWYGTRWLKVRCESAMAKCSLAHIRVGEPGADGKFELQWLIPRITKKKFATVNWCPLQIETTNNSEGISLRKKAVNEKRPVALPVLKFRRKKVAATLLQLLRLGRRGSNRKNWEWVLWHMLCWT